LTEDLPRGETILHPRHPDVADDSWIAEVVHDLAHLPVIEPDDAETRCSLVRGYLPPAMWMIPQRTEREARSDWPADTWVRLTGRDDVLLHPGVQAVRIFCTAKEYDPTLVS
jgi:hypothetical protein